MAIDEHIHRFSSDDYLRIIESGSLARERVELVDGLIVDMTPQGEHHAFAIQSLSGCFTGSPPMLRVQLPLAVMDGWVPEPDLAITERLSSFDRPPSAAFLVVEVAVSSKAGDLRKAAPYAARGIPTYWLVDVPAQVVLEHTHPGPNGYEVVRRRHDDDVLDAHVDGMAPIAVRELFVP